MIIAFIQDQLNYGASKWPNSVGLINTYIVGCWNCKGGRLKVIWCLGRRSRCCYSSSWSSVIIIISRLLVCICYVLVEGNTFSSVFSQSLFYEMESGSMECHHCVVYPRIIIVIGLIDYNKKSVINFCFQVGSRQKHVFVVIGGWFWSFRSMA